jgi:hypothetical protein
MLHAVGVRGAAIKGVRGFAVICVRGPGATVHIKSGIEFLGWPG